MYDVDETRLKELRDSADYLAGAVPELEATLDFLGTLRGERWDRHLCNLLPPHMRFRADWVDQIGKYEIACWYEKYGAVSGPFCSPWAEDPWKVPLLSFMAAEPVVDRHMLEHGRFMLDQLTARLAQMRAVLEDGGAGMQARIEEVRAAAEAYNRALDGVDEVQREVAGLTLRPVAMDEFKCYEIG